MFREQLPAREDTFSALKFYLRENWISPGRPLNIYIPTVPLGVYRVVRGFSIRDGWLPVHVYI